MKQFLVFLIISVLVSCKQEPSKEAFAQTLIDKSIEASGGEIITNSTIAFDFRDKHYKAFRADGIFQLERIFKDSIFKIKDVLNNDGFKRHVDENEVKVADSMVSRYSASVNSVHYFSVLPYGLNDAAVNKSYLGDVEIEGKSYHKIKVTFSKIGGGEDHDDEFIYWLDANTFKVDYLAYSYREADGFGFRFRKAYNERYINAVRFVDYENYKPKNNTDLMHMDRLYERDSLELISIIALKNIKVTTN